MIYKYPLEFDSVCEVPLPEGAHVLKVAIQGEPVGGKPQLFIWAEVDPDAPIVSRRFVIAATGRKNQHLYSCRHLDTVFDRDFVWHIYEGTERRRT